MGILQTMGGGGGALSVSASNVTASGDGNIACGNPGPTGIPNAAVSGGTGNNEYQWTRISGTPTYGPWQCSDRTILNPTWHAPDPVCDEGAADVSEVWELAVTDNSSGQLGSAQITVSLTFTDNRVF